MAPPRAAARDAATRAPRPQDRQRLLRLLAALALSAVSRDQTLSTSRETAGSLIDAVKLSAPAAKTRRRAGRLVVRHLGVARADRVRDPRQQRRSRPASSALARRSRSRSARRTSRCAGRSRRTPTARGGRALHDVRRLRRRRSCWPPTATPTSAASGLPSERHMRHSPKRLARARHLPEEVVRREEHQVRRRGRDSA